MGGVITGHTPLPWTCGYHGTKWHIKSLGREQGTPTVARIDIVALSVPLSEREANGELIVKAVNCHDILLAAAQDALSKIDDCADGKLNFRRDFGDRLREAIERATQ